MTKKWKYNRLEEIRGKYKDIGEAISHPEAGVVGRVFSGSSEIVAEVAANAAETSDEVNDLLDEL